MVDSHGCLALMLVDLRKAKFWIALRSPMTGGGWLCCYGCEIPGPQPQLSVYTLSGTAACTARGVLQGPTLSGISYMAYLIFHLLQLQLVFRVLVVLENVPSLAVHKVRIGLQIEVERRHGHILHRCLYRR